MVTKAEWPPRLDIMTDDSFMQNAAGYAARHQLELMERLGFGIHGIIHAAKNKSHGGRTAVKVHRQREPFLRESEIYEFLRESGISRIHGFHVPQLIRFDYDLLVIEMTIVTRPFVLDFAGAYLDFPPEFSEEVWAHWEAEKIEQFGNRWPNVQQVLGALEEVGIHMVDVSPSNIAYTD